MKRDYRFTKTEIQCYLGISGYLPPSLLAWKNMNIHAVFVQLDTVLITRILSYFRCHIGE
jgi:hypothetical protein